MYSSRPPRVSCVGTRVVVPVIALLIFLSPLFLNPAESTENPPHRWYLPLAWSVAQPAIPWSPPVQIDAMGQQTTGQISPIVALDNFGNGYAIWREGCPNCRNYLSARPAGAESKWSIPEILYDSGDWQDHASMTTDLQGNLYVIFMEAGKPVLLRRSLTGSWGEPEVVPMPPGSGEPHIAADARGRLHLLYKVYKNGIDEYPIDLFHTMRDETGVWHQTQQVNDRPGSLYRVDGNSGTPSLAVDGEGNAHAAWREDHNWNWRIYYSHQLPDGSWSPNEVIDPDHGHEQPSLAVDEQGNAYVAFAANVAGSPEVRFAYRPANGPWQLSVRINEWKDGLRSWSEEEGPSLQIDETGSVFVIWTPGASGSDPLYFDWRPPISGDASDPNLWHKDETITAFYQIEAQDLTANRWGDLMAVWFQYSRESEAARVPRIYVATRP